jgi:hypothetical protein
MMTVRSIFPSAPQGCEIHTSFSLSPFGREGRVSGSQRPYNSLLTILSTSSNTHSPQPSLPKGEREKSFSHA